MIDQLRPTDQITKGRVWLDRDKASDLSKSGRIAIDLTKKQLTKHKNKCKDRYRSGTDVSSGSEAKGLEPAKGLKPTAKLNVQKIDVRR